MKAKDFKNVNELIINGISETLLAEGVKADVVEQFIQRSPEIVYAKTPNRSLVAKMNSACNTIYFYADRLEQDTIYQIRVNMSASHSLVGDGNKDYMYPNESMYKDLEAFADTAIFSCTAVELEITLDLEKHKVWRRIVVPLNITFQQLHLVLQIVFDWKDYHLHDYYIFDDNKPIVNLVCSDDAFDYPNDVPMIMETNIKLPEYIPKYSQIKYAYDFGDDWQHTIIVQKVIEDYSQNYPVCVAGEGNTPPEDVGGEGGYDEFLEAIANPKHPEHNAMLNWANSQWYRDFDIDLVNRRLKNSLKR